MVDYTIAAHPTVYSGVRFRSRLEATWAAFFDLCGWQWDYEPLDLRAWVPDFVLHGLDRVAVEVKPIYALDDFTESDRRKVAASRWSGEVLVLGCGPYEYDRDWLARSCIGWLLDESGCWANAILGKYDDARSLDFTHDLNSPHGRITGHDDGFPPYSDYASTTQLWRRARNLTQWQPTQVAA